MASVIKKYTDELSGDYLSKFLNAYFKQCSVYDDNLMELSFETESSFPSHDYACFEYENRILRIQSSPHMVSSGTTGGYIWDAGVAMADHIILNAPGIVKGRNVVELGSGTGLVGIVASVFGNAQNVCLTDLAGVLKRYAEPNAQAYDNITCREFDWRYPEAFDFGEFDVLLASDVLYDPEIVPVLVKVLEKAREGGVDCYIAQRIRNPDTFKLFLNSFPKNIDIIDMPEQGSHFFYSNPARDIKLIHLL